MGLFEAMNIPSKLLIFDMLHNISSYAFHQLRVGARLIFPAASFMTCTLLRGIEKVMGGAPGQTGSVKLPHLTKLQARHIGLALAVAMMGLVSPCHAAINASQTLVLQTGGTERARLTATGFGIGTVPQQKLHISYPSSGDILLNSVNTGVSRSIHIRVDGANAFINNMNNFVNNGSSGNGFLTLTGQTGISLNYGNAGSVGTEALRITSAGNVGIGTMTPSVTLHVNGNIRANTPVANDDLTTKAYVDSAIAAASSGRPKYMGVSSASSNGAMGGILPFTNLCTATYPNSRAMQVSDILDADYS